MRYSGLCMQSWITKYLPFLNIENVLFSFMFYSGMDDSKSSIIFGKTAELSCVTVTPYISSNTHNVTSWLGGKDYSTLTFNGGTADPRKICRNSEMAQKQIWIHSSDMQIWWNGCECGLFVFNRRRSEQKKVVISTRQVWMLVWHNFMVKSKTRGIRYS